MSSIEIENGEPKLSDAQRKVEHTANQIAAEAVRISGVHSSDEIMEVIVNNIQALISSVVPFKIPPQVMNFLKGRKLGKHQTDILLSIAAKIIAYAGMQK